MVKQAKRPTKAEKQHAATIETYDGPTEFVSPESSSIAGARYVPGTGSLLIWFKRPNGEEQGFRYGNVPLTTWMEFEQAGSKGRFVQQVIKPLYSGTAV